MKRTRLLLFSLLLMALTVGLFIDLDGEKTYAAAKPSKAKVTAKANTDGNGVTLTIAKTKNAQGYRIMVKKPGEEKFTKLTTIKKDGSAKRTYTVKNLTAGEYLFKVRAYRKSGNKTIWGKYSKVVTVTVSKTKNLADQNEPNNSKETATSATVGTVYKGVLSSAGDRDCYRIKAQNDCYLSFVFEHAVKSKEDGVGWEVSTYYDEGYKAVYCPVRLDTATTIGDFDFYYGSRDGYYYVFVELSENSPMDDAMKVISETEYSIVFQFNY